MPQASAAPERLGKYELLEMLHQTSTSVIYRGRDPGLDRDVAIKVLRPSSEIDAATIDRFLDEARLCARLRHPNIVTIYGAGEDEGRHYIVMQLLGGQGLHEIIAKQAPLSRARTLRILYQAASALDHAHECGLVHRDVKPGNIMVEGGSDAVTLVDFGIAMQLSNPGWVADGTVVGTPAYMSTEQARGEDATPASDIYGLGVVAFEMLSARLPFLRDDEQLLLHAQVYEPVPALGEIREGFAPEVDAVLCRAMAKDAMVRWPSALAFVRELDQALRIPPPRPPRFPRVSRSLLLQGGAAVALVGAVVALGSLGPPNLAAWGGVGSSRARSTDEAASPRSRDGGSVDRKNEPATTPPTDATHERPRRDRIATDTPPAKATGAFVLATSRAGQRGLPSAAVSTPAPSGSRTATTIPIVRTSSTSVPASTEPEPSNEPRRPTQAPPTQAQPPTQAPPATDEPPSEPRRTDPPPPPVPPTEPRPPRTEEPRPTIPPP